MNHELEIGRADAVAQVTILRNGLYRATARAEQTVAASSPMPTPRSALQQAVVRLAHALDRSTRAIVESADVGADYEANFVGRIVAAGGAV